MINKSFFLILEQIALSHVAQVNMLLGKHVTPGEMASQIPKIFYTFVPQLNAFLSVGILCISIFVCKLL